MLVLAWVLTVGLAYAFANWQSVRITLEAIGRAIERRDAFERGGEPRYELDRGKEESQFSFEVCFLRKTYTWKGSVELWSLPIMLVVLVVVFVLAVRFHGYAAHHGLWIVLALIFGNRLLLRLLPWLKPGSPDAVHRIVRGLESFRAMFAANSLTGLAADSVDRLLLQVLPLTREQIEAEADRQLAVGTGFADVPVELITHVASKLTRRASTTGRHEDK